MAFPTDGVLLSTYSEVLKRFYLPTIQEQLNNMNVLTSYIEVNEDDISGKEATINCHYGRSTGTGARADGGSLPDADYQKHKTATVPMKYQYGRVTFSGPTIAATRDAKGSYAKVIDNEVTGIAKDLAKEINRQYWGAGYGVLGRWRTTGAATTYTLQKLYRGNTAGGDGFGSTFGAKYFSENSAGVPVVLTTAGSTVTVATVDTTDIAVSAIAETSTYDTITATDPGVVEAAGTFYVRPGNMATVTAATSTAGAGRYEMMGLRGIVTDENIDNIVFYDGTDRGMSALPDPLQGLNVDSYSWWKAIVDDSGTRYGAQRDLTLSMMQKMFDKVEIAAGKDYGPDMILTSYALRREYLELCRIDRRSVNTMSLDGGFTALDYNGVPFVVDPDAIDGEIYFLTMKDLQLYRMSDYQWMDKDGAVLARISGYDAYEAVLFRYAELGCTRRNSQGVLCDLNYED